ncbi:TetR/AcrR family transcriptional regulator [Paracoccus seriniphilus]|uniref:Transcriptional regulator, TetR family n=1 Tax=Paracoccus seriniphilus TaxID=184748 RepID=A0A239PNJ9_9RHOB|nr:TetR/AcrR family transcriptional regulator [Paracoccus seriniphilus]WCR14940.1 TetR/AcrR family transcriptional regulator [Paracoccus seriniphilus]SNT71633.1 transcriptional regulator, TetR family [Paracoccus seriniphilus]
MSPQTSRRFRTARRIQAAAVALASRHGLANVTTEAIAQKAEISTRTFFNHYPYKEAAIMGPPPDYPADAAERFASSTGRLIDDLNILIESHLSRFRGDREMVAQITRLASQDQKVAALFSSAILARRAQMRELLKRRLPDTDNRKIEILAAAIVGATNGATREWVTGPDDDLISLARSYLGLIVNSAELLND